MSYKLVYTLKNNDTILNLLLKCGYRIYTGYDGDLDYAVKGVMFPRNIVNSIIIKFHVSHIKYKEEKQLFPIYWSILGYNNAVDVLPYIKDLVSLGLIYNDAVSSLKYTKIGDIKL